MSRNNILAILLVSVLVMSVFGVVLGSAEERGNISDSEATLFSGGSGTEEDPYLIENIDELQGMDNELGAHYQLAANIDASGTSNFDPVGDPPDPFTGSLDGAGYEITGLSIDRSDDYVGLFGATGSSSTITDIDLIDVEVYGREDGSNDNRDQIGTGTLVGLHQGEIKDAHADGRAEGGWQVGGLVSVNEGTIERSSTSVEVLSVDGTFTAGGFVGRNDGTISRSFSNQYVKSEPWELGIMDVNVSNAGGFVGINDNRIESCYATGGTEGAAMGVGGFAAQHRDGTIINSYSAGTVDSYDNEYLGGFAGFLGERPNGYLQIEDDDPITLKEDLLVDPGFEGTSFWDKESSGEGDGVGSVKDGDDSGLTGKTTSEMKTEATFTDAGWDFENVWGIDDTTNDGYPFLAWEQGPNEYALTINAEEGGTTNPEPGTSTHEAGTDVTVEAVPDEGWQFKEWTGARTGTDPTIEITMDEDKEITAVFEEAPPTEYELTINIEGEGTTDPGEGPHTYEEGSNVTVTATADEGWVFFEWTGDEKGDDTTIEITMDDNKSITANFEELKPEFEITDFNVDPTEGEVPLEVDIAAEIENVGDAEGTITLETDGEELENWTLGPGDTATVDETYTYDEEDLYHVDLGDESIAVEVGEVTTYNLDVETDGDGTVNVEPDRDNYQEGVDVNLTAEPAQGWGFIEWTGTDETGEEITITMDEDKSVTARFEILEYTLDISVEGEGSVDIDPDQDVYEHGTEVTLTAEPAEGYVFGEWTGTDETGEEITITMEEDEEITAVFEEIVKYDLTIDAGEGGTTDPETGTYTHEEDTEVTVEAVPDDGYKFVEWTGDHESTEEQITIVMDSDKEINAVFEEEENESCQLQENTEGDGSVKVEPDKEEYEEGEEVTLTAEPKEGWKFKRWSGDVPLKKEEDKEVTIEVSGDMDVTAEFVKEDGSGNSMIESNLWLILIVAALIAAGVVAAILLRRKKEKDQKLPRWQRFLFEVGKHFGFGMGMFGTLGVSLVLLAWLMEVETQMFIMILFVTLLVTPLLSLFVGVFEGKHCSSSVRAAISGSLTGLVGFFVILFAIFGVVMVSSVEGDGGGHDMMGPELMLAFGVAALVAGAGGGCLGRCFYCEKSRARSEDTKKEGFAAESRQREPAGAGSTQVSGGRGTQEARGAQEAQQEEAQRTTQQESSTSQEQESTEKSSTPCPDCGEDLDYIEDHERWYCWSCEEYK